MTAKALVKKAPVFIICDICKAEIEQVDARQVRCQPPEGSKRGVKSVCQIIANDRAVAAFRQKKKDNNRTCLKCNKRFLGKGPYNRICDKCEGANSRMTRIMHKVSPC